MRLFIGIDNGVTGSVGVVSEDLSIVDFHKIPTKKDYNYTKTKQNITRIDVKALINLFCFYAGYKNVRVFIERPMVNPKRFKQSLSAVRALEATLIALEEFQFPYQFIDSKEWQKEMLPKNISGSRELKEASKKIGERLFPKINFYKNDCDSLLIAEWARRNNK